jgi:hypothetical protein
VMIMLDLGLGAARGRDKTIDLAVVNAGGGGVSARAFAEQGPIQRPISRI